MFDWLLIYLYLSAGISLATVYDSLYHSEKSEEYMLEAEDIADTMGVKPGWIIALMFTATMCLGWIFLPIIVFNKIRKVLNK